MTVDELIKKFNDEFSKDGIDLPWPPFYFVDHETYANCCQFMFDNPRIYSEVGPTYKSISVAVGSHNGLMLKNIELILEERTKL